MRRLLLWDVDGTLLRSRVGATAFVSALTRTLGREVASERLGQLSFGGKTDPQIARELLALAQVADDEHDAHLPTFLRHLEHEVAAAAERIRTDGRLLPGVRELLERLARAGHVQTLLTGNLATTAAVKVGAFGLERHLDLEIGAYGSDDADRRRLVPLALARAAERHRAPFGQRETWVIGDTPRDLECARAGGVRCLLVATGTYGIEELESAGADAVVPDLADTAAIARLLES